MSDSSPSLTAPDLLALSPTASLPGARPVDAALEQKTSAARVPAIVIEGVDATEDRALADTALRSPVSDAPDAREELEDTARERPTNQEGAGQEGGRLASLSKTPRDVRRLQTSGVYGPLSWDRRLEDATPGRYQRVKEIARGGMGRIWLAEDTQLGRRVALKELLVDRLDARHRFEREALITAQLQHPNIVNVHDAGRWPSGEFFYVMDRIVGESLRGAIRREADLEGRLALLPHLTDVADAMAYAHARGVIHRDLKPSNVLVGTFGETIIIDWGIARFLGDDEEAPDTRPIPRGAEDLTIAGFVVGTPAYMSPEQARGDALDERADVYAIGAMLYALLAGHAPYQKKADATILEQLAEGPPPSLDAVVEGIPEALLSIVQRAMHRSLAQRYRDATALAEDLRRFEAGKRVSAHRYTPRQLILRWLGQHRQSVIVAGAAALLLMGMASWSLGQLITERDRAEDAHEQAVASQRHAERAQRDEKKARLQALTRHAAAERAERLASERADAMTLLQARSVIERDPTLAVAWLKQLDESADWEAARSTLIDARERGIAAHRFQEELQWFFTPPLAKHGQLFAFDLDHGLWRWDFDARTRAKLTGAEGGPFLQMQITSDQRHLLGLGASGTLTYLDLEDGSARVFSESRSRITRARLIPGTDRAVLFLAKGQLDVCDPDEGISPLVSFEGHVLDGAITADGQSLRVFVKEGGRAGVFEVELQTGTQARLSLPGLDPATSAHRVEFSQDARWVAVPVAGAVLAFDLTRPELEPWRYPVTSEPTVVAFSADSRALTITQGRAIHRVSMSDPTEVRILEAEGADGVFELLHSPDGRFLGALSGPHGTLGPRTLSLWYLSEEGSVQPLPTSGMSDLTFAFFAQDRPTLITYSRDRSLRVYDLVPPKGAALFSDRARAQQTLTTPRGDVFVSDDGGRIFHWRPGFPRGRLIEDRPGRVHLMSATPGGERVFFAHHSPVGEQRVYWVDLQNGERGALPETMMNNAPTFAPEGHFMAADANPSSVYLWRLPEMTMTVLPRVFPPTHPLPARLDPSCIDRTSQWLRFSPDGRFLASHFACAPLVFVWDLEGDVEHPKVLRFDHPVVDLSFSPDARRVLVAREAAAPLSVNLENGDAHEVEGLEAGSRRLVFSPDRQWLVSLTRHGHLSLAHATDRTLSHTPHLPDSRFDQVSFGPRGRYLVTLAPDSESRRVAYLWDLIRRRHRVLRAQASIIHASILTEPRGLLLVDETGLIRFISDDLPDDPSALRQWLAQSTSAVLDRFGRADTAFVERALGAPSP